MSFQVGIGSLCGIVFFQVGLCTPLRTMNTSQQELTRVWHESTRVNTNQHESDTSQHESLGV